MYITPLNGNAEVSASATPQNAARLADLRYQVLDAVTYSPYTTADEQARTVASVARCHSGDVLVKWYCNVLTLLSARELAPVAYATGEQQQEIVRLLNHPAVTRRHKTRVLVGLNRLKADEAQAEINRLTAYVAAPFGGGAMVSSDGELVGFSLTA